MPKYVALLRGINVSGQKMIKMDHLRSMFETMNFHSVSTYIQSGNVVFDGAEEEKKALEGRIESELARVFGFDVTVIVRTPIQLEQIVRDNPYKAVNKAENEQIYVSFLSQSPTAAAIDKLASFRNDIDDFQVVHHEVYMLIRKGYGNSKFSNNFLEKKLGVSATTRNWETVNKLIQLAEERG